MQYARQFNLLQCRALSVSSSEPIGRCGYKTLQCKVQNAGRFTFDTTWLCPPISLQVNAETKVHWFFVEGAFVLNDVHGRDSTQLQKGTTHYNTLPRSSIIYAGTFVL